MKVFRGTLVHCKVPEKIEILEDHLIGVDDNNYGKIVFVERCTDLEVQAGKHGFSLHQVHTLSKSQFLVPGFVDTHIHAPQYPNSGTGYDKQLLQWLDTYTFPTEAQFLDPSFAKKVYPKVVSRTLKHGTTTACYFATIHLESSKELCRIVDRVGQRALVGKVNMDQESPQALLEDTLESVKDTREFVSFVRSMNNPLVQPIITPRFAPTCSERLLKLLGDVARENDTRIQSHICEQKPEVTYTLGLFPEHKNCASIFDSNDMLTDKTVMAHCIYLEDAELEMFRQKGVGIAHCPNSNFCLSSGILDTRRMLDLNMKIGLGTDVSGGYSPSILDAMRTAVHASKAMSFEKPDGYKPITHHEALYLATLGGAKVLALDDKIGTFEVGKEFDALLVDTSAPKEDPVFDVFDKDSMEDRVMKFIYLADDRNLVKVFVAGKEIWFP